MTLHRTSDLDAADVVEHLNEGLQVVGPDFRYLYVNRVAAKQGRRTPETLVGRTMSDVYPGIERTEMFRALERLMRSGGSRRMEREVTFADGSTGWFELRMTRIPQGVLILSLDVTERKALERGLRRAQRMEAVGLLAGGIAHDFNNILTVIQSYATFIEEQLHAGNPMREDVSCILDASRRAADLTHRLLAFARQMPIAPRPLIVSQALEDLRWLLCRVLGEHVVLSVDCADDVGAVFIDPAAFGQIFLDLGINARDAMPEGGALTIEARPIDPSTEWDASRGVTLPAGAYVMISVTDTGTGITDEVLERIFDPFFSTKSEDSRGLGLASCWGLVQQAGGTISVQRPRQGGTSFRVYLPRTDANVRSLSSPGRLRGVSAQWEPVPRASGTRERREEG